MRLVHTITGPRARLSKRERKRGITGFALQSSHGFRIVHASGMTYEINMYAKPSTWDVLYLIGEVDGGVHDAGAVGSYRVGDVPDADRVEVLVVALRLHEDLPREEREI